MDSKDEYKEKVRSELVKILGRSTFGKDVIEQRFTGVHFARGLRSIDEAVASVVTLEPEVKKEVYKLGKKLSKIDSEMAFHYFRTAADAINHFNFEDMQKWVDKGITFHERYGIIPARNFFKGITRETIEEIHSVGLDLDKVNRILSIYVDALSGGRLKIAGTKEDVHTDTRTIFLPDNISEFEKREDNFLIYKVIAAHKYGQLRYRSFDINPKKIEGTIKELNERYAREEQEGVSVLEKFINMFPQRKLAIDIFSIVENTRVETYLRREFKGLGRDLDRVLEKVVWKNRPEFRDLSDKDIVIEGILQNLLKGRIKKGFPKEWKKTVDESCSIVNDMLKSRATVEDSVTATAGIYALLDEKLGGVGYSGVPEVTFRGNVRPRRVTIALKETENELTLRMKKLLEELEIEIPDDLEDRIIEVKNEVLDPYQHTAPLEFLAKLNVDIPDEVWEKIKKEIERRLGELGEIDASLLTKVLDSAGRMVRAKIEATETTFQVELTDEDMETAFLYDEWDYKMGHYRAKWCALREKHVKKGNEAFVDKTLEKYIGLVHLIRRQFEMLRPQYRKLKRQFYGEEIDIDAFIEAKADMKAGVTPSEKLYIKTDKRERDIAVAFLVDLSGSTTGWVIETEKEALVLMCEALQILGDKYAIFGFSGRTRKQCDFYKIKDFEETYSKEIKARISGMDASDYTRMGPPIRHLNDILEKESAKIKIMIILSDGKPEDFDEYKGEVGIEDTRKALIEAKRKHIRPFCITIDKGASDYISRMYGDVSYIILDDIKDLPRKLPEVYRKLTT